MSGVTFKEDKLNGFAAGNTLSSTIGKTVNGGTSWASQPVGSGVGGYCNLKWVHGTNIVYLAGATGASGVVKRSTDGGATWTQMTTNGITGITHMEYFKEANNVIHIYAVAGDGSIIRYRDSSLVTGIDPNNSNVPTSFVLQQNYPNPFNPSTTIKYSVPTAGNVLVKIYNTLGIEVKTVINKFHTTGNYVEIVDMDGFASGVYFYTMQAGDFKDTKRMILVK
jgi:hypothetical protein